MTDKRTEKLKSRDGWKWYGYPGHLIVGAKCAYHLATRVGDYFISTVGDYRANGIDLPAETIGAGKDSFYETCVFRCDGDNENGDPNITDWGEIDGERYASSIEAERGHYSYCEKYAADPPEGE